MLGRDRVALMAFQVKVKAEAGHKGGALAKPGPFSNY